MPRPPRRSGARMGRRWGGGPLPLGSLRLTPPLRLGLGARSILGLARADGRDALRERNLELLRSTPAVVEVRQDDPREALAHGALDGRQITLLLGRHEDRKSTRLNSSHSSISY